MSRKEELSGTVAVRPIGFLNADGSGLRFATDSDSISYSPSRSSRRGVGGPSDMKTVASAYMAVIDGIRSSVYLDSLWRRYKRMSKDIDYLHRLDAISTISPKNFTDVDVYNYLLYRRSLGVSDAEMVHESSALSNIMDYVGNQAYRQAVAKWPYLKASAQHKRLPSLSDAEVQSIIVHAGEVPDSDWTRMVSYAVVITSICGGLRSKELRLAEIRDVSVGDGEHWTIEVRHPKGEGRYGFERSAPIHPDAIPFLKRYFMIRASHVLSNGSGTNALFVGAMKQNGFLASNTLRKYCKVVCDDVGFDFDLRKCRRTYGQRFLDMHTEIAAVSIVMGHNSTRTTELAYARIKNTMAIEEIQKAIDFDRSARTNAQLPSGLCSEIVGDSSRRTD